MWRGDNQAHTLTKPDDRVPLVPVAGLGLAAFKLIRLAVPASMAPTFLPVSPPMLPGRGAAFFDAFPFAGRGTEEKAGSMIRATAVGLTNMPWR